jgi:hypothetical protein
MKRLLAIILLILSFSFNHLTFGQTDCVSTCRCRTSWTVYYTGCAFTFACYDDAHLSCQPGYNHCCYYEYGYCNDGSCGSSFYFRQCFLGNCNY